MNFETLKRAGKRFWIDLTNPQFEFKASSAQDHIRNTLVIGCFGVDFGSIIGRRGDHAGMSWACSGHVPGIVL